VHPKIGFARGAAEFHLLKSREKPASFPDFRQMRAIYARLFDFGLQRNDLRFFAVRRIKNEPE
jgi:hypothetical protein